MIFKASRIAHLTDARYFAARAVDYLGFNFEEGTEGYLDPIYMKAIREWVEGPKIVGEFEQKPVAEIREAARFFELDMVQVSATRHGEHLAALQDLPLILSVKVDAQGMGVSLEKLQEWAAYADMFLFDFSGSNYSKSKLFEHSEEWRAAFELLPSLLQADFPAEDWPELLETLGAQGLSIVGGEEEKTGVKSYDQIEAIFEAFYHA